MDANKLRKRLPDSEWTITVVAKDDIHDYQPGYLFIPFGMNTPQQIRRSSRQFLSPDLTVVMAEVERVARVREIVGDDFIIVCDANQGWQPRQAVEFCRAAESLKLGWIEEPVAWYDQLEGLRMVRDSSSIPVNVGQGEITAFGCRDLITSRSVDILNVDATVSPGVTEWRRIAAMA